MNKETMKKVCTVIIAICAIVLMYEFVDMLFLALSTDDMLVITQTDSNKEILLLGKWTMLMLCFAIIATAVISVLHYFDKSKTLGFLTCGLYILTTLLAIAFVIVVYLVCKGDSYSSTDYASGVMFCEKYLQVAVASAVLGAYYTVCTVQSLKNKDGTDGCNDGCNVDNKEGV